MLGSLLAGITPTALAASQPVTVGAASGVKTAPATSLADLTASSGQTLKFALAATPSAAGFTHPGVLVTRAQLDYAKAQVQLGNQPWLDAFNKAKNHSNFGVRAPHLTRMLQQANPSLKCTTTSTACVVDCGSSASPDNGCTDETVDFDAAYDQALLWYFTGQEAYAQAAITQLNSWSAVLKNHTNYGGALQAAWSAETIARTAEIIRYTYTPSAGKPAFNVDRFTSMLNTAFLPAIQAGGYATTNGNWDLSAIDGKISIAIFTDNRALFNEALDQWRARTPAYIYMPSDGAYPVAPPGGKLVGNQAVTCFWLNQPGNCTASTTFQTGQIQESCRDYNHVGMGLASMFNAAESAYLQGVNLYAEQKDRLAAGLEHTSHILNTVTTVNQYPADFCIGHGTLVSPVTMPTYEIGYNALVNRLGMSLPETLTTIRRNQASTASAVDHMMGWEALTHYGTGNICTASDSGLGSAVVTTSVANAGTYRVWTRVKPLASSASLLLQVDGNCAQTVEANNLTPGQWVWISTPAGAPTSKVMVTLTAGSHAMSLLGKTPGLQVDTVMLADDLTCQPDAAGISCTPTVVPDILPPSAPSTVSATNISTTGLTLAWTASADDVGVDHYQVLRDGVMAGPATVSTSLVDTALMPNTTYTYTVYAVDAAGNVSPASEAVTAHTLPLPDTEPPSGPTALTISATTATTVGLVWAAASDNVGVDHYVVSRDGVAKGSTTELTMTDTGLAPLTSYDYTVVAVDAAGNTSAPTMAVGATTQDAPDTNAPTVPTNVTASSVTTGELTLSWTASTDNIGVHHYVVMRDGSVLGQQADTMYSDTGLLPATTYSYTVAAVDADGNVSPISGALEVSTLAPPDLSAPSAPTNLAASSVTETGLTLSWAASSDDVAVDHYVITRDSVIIGQATTTNYVDSGLTAATSYGYGVSAVDAASNVSASSVILAVTTPDTTAPTVPGGVTATNVTTTGVTLTWQTSSDNVAVDHYIVKRGGSVLGQVVGSVFTDTNLEPSTGYTYLIMAVDAAGNLSLDSAPQTITTLTPPDTTSPTVPNNFTAQTLTSALVKLGWSASTDNIGVDHYVLSRNGATLATLMATTFTDATVLPSTTYTYELTATDAAGNSSTGATTTVTTPAPPDTSPPTMPSNFAAQAISPTQVNVSWTPSTDNIGVHHYSLTRNGTTIANQTSLSLADTGLAPSTNYTYTVTAYDAAGNSSGSASVAVATPAPPDTTAPTVPTGVTVLSVTTNQVSLKWTAATDNIGVSTYEVYRGTTKVGTTASLTYTDTGLSAATSYNYTVKAVDAAGNRSGSSAGVVATTATPPDTTVPSTPTGVAVSAVTTSQVSLRWAAATDNIGVTGYEVYRGSTKVATVATLTYTDTNLSQSTSYSYTIKARDAAGNVSLATASITALTATPPDTAAPSTPAILTATISGLGQVTLSWPAATDNVRVVGYKLTRAGSLIASPNTLSYIDSGLMPGTTYTYTIAAFDAAGNTSPAKPANVTTPLDAAPAGAGFAGAYFNNASLSGPAIGRLDPTINFAWGAAAPLPGVNPDNFSARWTGLLTPSTTGTYTFYSQSDDGVRLYLNDKLLIDKWVAGNQSNSATAALTAGTSYNLRFEYYEATGSATANLQWSGPGVAKAVIPATVMKSASNGLSGAYFTNNALTGLPSVLRLDNTVGFDWVTGTPDARLPTDNFSARWTGRLVAPASGSYTFYTDSDDGVRLWVNGVQLINNWTSHALVTNSGKITLTAGTMYDIRMEYQELANTAVAKLSWSYGAVAKTIIPSSALRDR